jgi:hypothetical protein
MRAMEFPMFRVWTTSSISEKTSPMQSAFTTAFRLGIASVLIVLVTGCQCIEENTFGGRLWTSGDFAHYRNIDRRAPVTLHHSAARNDFLLRYTEVRDGDEKPRLRAYFVQENAEQTAAHRQPRFVPPNQPGLRPVPLNGDTNALPRARLNEHLTIFASDGIYGPFPLPEYQETDGTATKIALTPVAIVGDLALVSLLAALFAAIVAGESGASFSGP